MISRSIWMKALLCLLVPSTPCPRRKLVALCKFIDKNLATGFIHPLHSSHGAPVLFIHKKDSSLWLCIDFRGFNQIYKRDWYPLPLISDLLDVPWWHEFTPRSTSDMHTTWSKLQSEMNGKLHFKPDMALSVVGNAWRAYQCTCSL